MGAKSKRLELEVGKLKSIESIGDLVHLEHLELRGWAMDLAPLSRLTRLRTLTLHLDRGIKRFDALSALVSLESLTIEESGIVDLDCCATMTKLTELTIVGGLKQIAGLRKLGKLAKVTLDRTGVTDLRPLAGSRRTLRELSLRFSRELTDLTPIAALTELRDLNLFECRKPLRSLTPLAKLTKLEQLELDMTEIKDGKVAPLYKLGKLRGLGIELTSPGQLVALREHLPKTMIEAEVSEPSGKCKKYGLVKVFEPTGDEPWTIYQDLVDELEVSDQEDVEDLVSRSFKKASPALARKVSYDSEGDAFGAFSDDKTAIVALAKQIQQLIRAAADGD